MLSSYLCAQFQDSKTRRVLAHCNTGRNRTTAEKGYLQVGNGVVLIGQSNETRCYKQASSETCHGMHS